MKTWLEIAKSKLPEEFHPVIDAYAPTLQRMYDHDFLAWVGAIKSRMNRKAKMIMRDYLSAAEVARLTKTERLVMESIGRKMHNQRLRTGAFWTGMGNVALTLAAAWLSSKTGVPLVVTE